MTEYQEIIAKELKLRTPQVAACQALLDEGGTVPFIARYRKEATGSLDEVAVTSIRDRLEQLAELDKRKSAILKSLTERDLLSPELETLVKSAQTMVNLEDIYLPHRPKRRTRATIAREKGLEPLALLILEQGSEAPLISAEKYINQELAVETAEDALEGAKDIIAEIINEDQKGRELLRHLYQDEVVIVSQVIKGKEEEGAKYRDYFAWSELLKNAPSHRVLALRRAEAEGILSLTLNVSEEKVLKILEKLFVKNNSLAGKEVYKSLEDSYQRLLSLSLENEFRLWSKNRADIDAIEVFANNLNELLLAAPLGAKAMISIDPGFRSGCKVAVLNDEGSFLEAVTIWPHSGSEKSKQEAGLIILALLEKYKAKVVAVGNGTAGRETESFLRTLKNWPKEIPIVMVNESGASIYSASEIARNEFPDLDLTIRGAISIGRRLQDPLAELVKIEPKSIGVGQYQHDVNQKELQKSLDDVVISCVNKVGVESNTASEQLLTYVSGLGPSLAKNFIKYRNEIGGFKSRRDFLQVPRLGPKAFEQCAGFLRVRASDNPLDHSAVHPESYKVVKLMAKDLKATVVDLMKNPDLKVKIKLDNYITDSIGRPTLVDILAELDKPGLDPRQEFKTVSFAEGINKLADLSPGLKLNGVVTNVAAFGAFIDVGVGQDGLVHISELSDSFVKNPNEVVKVGEIVSLTVLSVDLARNRLGLSLKSQPQIDRSDASSETQARSKNIRATKKAPQKTTEAFNNPFQILGKKSKK